MKAWMQLAVGQGRRKGGRPGQWSSGPDSVSFFIEKKGFPSGLQCLQG